MIKKENQGQSGERGKPKGVGGFSGERGKPKKGRGG